MAKLSDIRAGVAARLATISGLRQSDYVPAQINPPIAVVGWPEEIDYDEAMGRGLDVYRIPIQVLVGTPDNRAANDALEAYLAKTTAEDPKSVKGAVESDRTLGGKVSDCVVTRMSGAGGFDYGGITYLGATWDLQVLA